MIIQHEYDSDYLLLALEEFEPSFLEKFRLIRSKSFEHSKETMEVVTESNRYSFGKVHLKITYLDNANTNFGNIFLRIKLKPYLLETKKI